MKKVIITILCLFIYGIGTAQILVPVKWDTRVDKISNTEFELIAIAKIENNWHLYSQIVPDNGPLPTKFTYQGNIAYLKIGNTSEEQGKINLDPIFKMEIKYFQKEAMFKQRIKLKNNKPFQVNCIVEYMACDDSRCLPPTEVKLVFNVN